MTPSLPPRAIYEGYDGMGDPCWIYPDDVGSLGTVCVCAYGRIPTGPTDRN